MKMFVDNVLIMLYLEPPYIQNDVNKTFFLCSCNIFQNIFKCFKSFVYRNQRTKEIISSDIVLFRNSSLYLFFIYVFFSS